MEKEKGHWIYQGFWDDDYAPVYECSVCFEDIIMCDDFKYCPYCGSEMIERKEKENDFRLKRISRRY